MPRIRHGLSPWLAAVPNARRPTYPRLTGTVDVPVVVIGGGLTGAATAYVFAAAGLRVALLEADRLGGGGTAASAGVMLLRPAGDFTEHEASHGRRAARALWQATRHAGLEGAATLRRLRIRCGLAAADEVVFAATSEQARRLAREANTRRQAGFDAIGLTAKGLAALGLEGVTGIRTKGHVRLNPYAACHGLTRAAAARGAAVFERSPATSIETMAHGVRVTTPKGHVDGETVILATGNPTDLVPGLKRHFVARETYLVQTPPLPAAVRAGVRDRTLLVEDRSDIPHRLFWTADDRVTWSGADQQRTLERDRQKVLVQRTGQLMYELSLLLPAISGIQPEFGWLAPYTVAQDGLPFVGPHRNYPRHLFALGLGVNIASAFLASRLLLRHCTGQVDKGDEHFGFARLAR